MNLFPFEIVDGHIDLSGLGPEEYFLDRLPTRLGVIEIRLNVGLISQGQPACIKYCFAFSRQDTREEFCLRNAKILVHTVSMHGFHDKMGDSWFQDEGEKRALKPGQILQGDIYSNGEEIVFEEKKKGRVWHLQGRMEFIQFS